VQAAAAPPGRHGTAGYRLPLALLDALPAALPHLLGAALLHHSLWWTAGSDDVEPCALLCRGLPAPGAYASLLAGTWAAAGW
jgi:type VI secretion system protein ImpM